VPGATFVTVVVSEVVAGRLPRCAATRFSMLAREAIGSMHTQAPTRWVDTTEQGSAGGVGAAAVVSMAAAAASGRVTTNAVTRALILMTSPLLAQIVRAPVAGPLDRPAEGTHAARATLPSPAKTRDDGQDDPHWLPSLGSLCRETGDLELVEEQRILVTT
jgi:hypothetical protein